MFDMIQRAQRFAYHAHQSKQQLRKYTNEPYINHPNMVACILNVHGAAPALIVAAYLHDTVEDTAVRISDIVNHFGEHIAVLVWQVTDVSLPEHGNRAHRKRMDREWIARGSPEAKSVKLADLIDNSSSIQNHDPDFAKIYMQEKYELLKVLVDASLPALWDEAYKIVVDYRQRQEQEVADAKN